MTAVKKKILQSEWEAVHSHPAANPAIPGGTKTIRNPRPPYRIIKLLHGNTLRRSRCTGTR